FELFVRGDFSGWNAKQKKAVKLKSASFTAGNTEVRYETTRIRGVIVADDYVKLRLKRSKLKSKDSSTSRKNGLGPGDPVSGTFTVRLYLGPEHAEETCFLEAIEYAE
ncbi:MAG: hypothetical protein KGQ61_11560, partial [Planctomycetes bacterium]|nr:hypothetical protein [Planctomycetota bacterium]